MDECPICLEPLSGTVVEHGCCHKKVHIQCYVIKCPMCRAELPAPTHARAPPQHVVVPVPVPVPAPVSPKRAAILNVIIWACLFTGGTILFTRNIII